MLEKETSNIHEGRTLRLELKNSPETFHLRSLQEQNTALRHELKEAQEQIRRILRWIRESFPRERGKIRWDWENSAAGMEAQIKQFGEGVESHQKAQLQQLRLLQDRLQHLEEGLYGQEQEKQKYRDMLKRQQQQFLQYQMKWKDSVICSSVRRSNFHCISLILKT